MRDLLRDEISDRLMAADEYEQAGRTDPAERLREEALALAAILDDA